MRSTDDSSLPEPSLDPNRADRALVAEARAWVEFWGAESSDDLRLIERLTAALARRVE